MTSRKTAVKTVKLRCPRCKGLNDWLAVTYENGIGYSYCSKCGKPSLRKDYKYVEAVEYIYQCLICDKEVDDAPRNWLHDLIIEQAVVYCQCMNCLGVSEKAHS